MNRVSQILYQAVIFLGIWALLGCEQSMTPQIQVEKLPEVKPNIPSVPTLPTPPYPVQYGDQSYSVYGLHRNLRKLIEQRVDVTAYIAKVFQPPECPEGERCPKPAAPHLWLADDPTEQDPTKQILLVGYADNQDQIKEAVEAAQKGKEQEEPPEDTGLLPIPVDFFQGAKIKVTQARYTYISGAGFQSSEGLLEYYGHQLLEPAPGQKEVASK